MFRRNELKMEEANGGEGGGAAGGGAPAAAPVTAEPINIAAPAANTGTPGEPAPAAATSWLDSLPEDIKKDPSLATFKSPDALAKSWVNAQKLIGANKVVVPGDKASEEEWNAFYNKIGRPESPDKYEVKAPEGFKLDDAMAKQMRETAHKLGLTPAQLNGLVAFDAERVKAAQTASADAEKSEIRNNLVEYQKTLGGEDKYKARVDEARFALKELGTPELNKFLEESNLGSHPQIIELFAKLKGMMGDGKIRDGTGTNFGIDPTVIQDEINGMMSDLNGAYFNPSHVGHSAAVEKVRILNERLVQSRSMPV